MHTNIIIGLYSVANVPRKFSLFSGNIFSLFPQAASRRRCSRSFVRPTAKDDDDDGGMRNFPLSLSAFTCRGRNKESAAGHVLAIRPKITTGRKGILENRHYWYVLLKAKGTWNK